MSTAAPVATQRRTDAGLPTSGFALVVDGRAKADFETHDLALDAARDLKGRFPKLQIKVYDAEKKLSEDVGLVVA
jgi:hypothetical protein